MKKNGMKNGFKSKKIFKIYLKMVYKNLDNILKVFTQIKGGQI